LIDLYSRLFSLNDMLKSLIGDGNKDLLIQTNTVKPLLHSILIDGKDPHGLRGPLARAALPA